MVGLYASQDVLIRLRVKKTDKRPFNILNNVNAVLKPVMPCRQGYPAQPLTFLRFTIDCQGHKSRFCTARCVCMRLSRALLW